MVGVSKQKALQNKLDKIASSSPGDKAWQALVDLIEQSRAGGDWEPVRQALPAVRQRLVRWPSSVPRLAPLAWINRLCFSPPAGGEQGPAPVYERHFPPGDCWFPVADDVYGERRAFETPELSLANTIDLGDHWEASTGAKYKPFDRLAFFFLRECPHVKRVQTLLHSEINTHNEYSAGPLIAPWFLGVFLGSPRWSGLRTVRVGRTGSNLGRWPLAGLRALEIVIDPRGDRPGADLFASLARNPQAAGLRALGLGNMVWATLPLGKMLRAKALSGLRELRLLELQGADLTDQGLTPQALVDQLVHVDAPRAMRLRIDDFEPSLEGALRALDGQTFGGWRVSVGQPRVPAWVARRG